MKLEEPRPGVFRATLTAHELSVLMAGARMSLSLMESEAPQASEQGRAALGRVLSDFDAELAKIHG
jgi:hypothetical protein